MTEPLQDVAQYLPAARSGSREALGQALEAYRAYGRTSAEVFARVGGRQIWAGRPEAVVTGPPDERWDLAFIAEYPSAAAFLEMVTDPNVPPVPPHLSGKQVRHYLQALLHGDPQAREVVVATAREAWDSLTAGREGRTGERPHAQVGMHSLRGGRWVGEHTVVLTGPHETLELTHEAHDRAAFADGALVALRFVARARPGRYGLADALADTLGATSGDARGG